MHPTKSLLLVDDHAVVCDGLRHIIEARGNWTCVIAHSADSAFQILKNQPIHVVLLDIALGSSGMDGIAALQIMRKEKPWIPILILSMLPEEQYVARVQRLGAAGFLSKSQSSTEILQAIEQVSRGGRLPTPPTTGLISHHELTNREFQILRLIGTGKGQTETAQILGLSVKTVATHRANLMQKMGFTNNSDIIRYTLEEGLAQ